jgi:hypothetical protein
MDAGVVLSRLQHRHEGPAMDLRFDQRQTVNDTVGSLESWQPRNPGLAFEEQGPVRATRPPYSYSAECECPDDCPRDHENE